jgi:hypothetical protein
MVTSFLTRRQALGGDDQFPVGVNPLLEFGHFFIVLLAAAWS